MASQDGNDDDAGNEPNLELPSLFGRRRKKSKDGAAPTEAGAAEPTPPAAPEARPPGPIETTRPLRPVAGAKRLPPSSPPSPGPEMPSMPRPSIPSLPGRLDIVVTGVAVALTGIAVLWLFLQGCTAVRGVSSCGGFGLVGITVTLVAQVVVGAGLLTAMKVAEPRSTAALGVGISATLAMGLFYASTPALATAIAMLALTPAAYVVAASVTSAEDDARD